MSHENDEMAVRPIVIGSAVSMLVLFLAWAVPTAMEGWLETILFDGRESAGELVGSGRLLPAGPRLQVNPDRDIERLREAEAQHLGSYAWVDPAAGIVRIPIQRAMELVAAGDRPVGSADASEGDAP